MTPRTTVTGELGSQCVRLPGGQRLVLRPVTVEDVDDLVGLFAGLSLGELHRRFFCVSRPDRASLEQLATVDERGGFGLVAVVSDPGNGPGRLVGQVGYEMLDNGDGELQLIVVPEWRDWLGRFLLHTIVGAAASCGVANLECEIRLANQPMLALARSFGAMFMPGCDQWSVRFVIGTRGAMPTWPGPHDRPRVLVEAPAGCWDADRAAVDAGLQVLVCPGPGQRRCPALNGQVCALAASADAIVMAARSSEEPWRALLEAYRPQHPGVPVCVGTSPAGSGDTGGAVQLSCDSCANRANVALVGRVAREHASRSDGWLGDRRGRNLQTP